MLSYDSGRPVVRSGLIFILLLAASCGSTPVAPSAVRPSNENQASVPPATKTVVVAPPSTPEQPLNGAPGAVSEAVVRSTPWVFDGQPGVLLTTRNYVLHTTVPDSRMLRLMPAFMEAALDHYASALTTLPRPDEAMNSYLFKTRDQWIAYTKERLPNEAPTYLKIGRGGYTTERETVFYDIGPDTFIIAAHEGWHQYTQTAFKHGLPIWLEEGMATFMEGYRVEGDRAVFRPWDNRERYRALRNLVEDGKMIPLTRLVNGSPQSFLNEGGRSPLLGYYAQVWGLVQFLNEGQGGKYAAALREVLHDAATGRLAGKLSTSTNIGTGRNRHLASSSRSGPWVLLAYFNRDLDTLEKEYEAFVRQITERENRGKLMRGESPVNWPIPAAPGS
jgi:hypothetical protein